jgi:acetyl-CoA carboxylase biotin carboxyl carrier protein
VKISEIKKILSILKENDIEEFELERDGIKLRIKKKSPQIIQNQMVEENKSLQIGENIPNKLEKPLYEETIEKEKEEEEKEELNYVTSPIVGTFYRAPNPDAQPYVEIGDRIEAGQVLCIIEAMKLMNEIVSDRAGEIVDIIAHNEQSVEYGERLFAIKPI